MASIGKDPNGRKRILFVASDGSRKTIRLGKCDIKQADAFRVKLESLLASRITGSVDAELARWLRDIPDEAHKRLSSVGLVPPRSSTSTSTTLGALLDLFFKSLTVKARTRTNYDYVRDALENHFGAACPVATIGPLEAERFAQVLRTSGLAPATASKRIKIARQVFKSAVKWKMAAENPFADVRAGSQVNHARACFVLREDIQSVLDCCPDKQWRLIVALSRFGALRCPSETLALRWIDIDWEKNQMLVRSTKTEHHENGHERRCPIFPELMPFLRDAFEKAEPGSEFVITAHSHRNLRTQLERIIAKAKVKQWPRLFHNMRASRQTELAAAFPLADVCAWLGNSPAIAASHYLQATDANFQAATTLNTGVEKRREPNPSPNPVPGPSPRQSPPNPADQRGTDSGTPKAQTPAQQPEAPDCTPSQTDSQVLDPCELTPETATSCESVHGSELVPLGCKRRARKRVETAEPRGARCSMK